MDKALRQIEAEQGWQHSNGLARWDEEKGRAVVYSQEELARNREEQGREKAINALANKLEIHGDTASLETYCRGQVAKDIKNILKRPGVNWQHIHATLKNHGLGMHAGHKGGYTVHSLSDHDGVKVRASQVFRDVFAGKANREKLHQVLGDFKPAVEKAQQVSTKAEYRQASLKRDPGMREQRRAERAQARQELKATFATYRSGIGQQRQALTRHFKTRFDSLAQDTRKRRQDFRTRPMDAAQRRALLSVLAAEAVQQRRALRSELAAQSPVMQTYREWVNERAPRRQIDPADQAVPQELAQLRAHYEANGFKLFSMAERSGTRVNAGSEYRGEIVHVTAHHVVQKTGANVLVAHPRGKLPDVVPGRVAMKIAYGPNGRAVATTEVKRARDAKREISR